jgi:hypothetical protein
MISMGMRIAKKGLPLPIKRQLQRSTKEELIALCSRLYAQEKLFPADLPLDQEKSIFIPCSVFTEALSPFESICKYLKEHLNMTYHEIAVLLDRDDRTIWTVYQHAMKKDKKPMRVHPSSIIFPVSLLRDRRLSVLEHLVVHVKEYYGMTYHEIAVLLKRDDRTIWTMYQRSLRKRKTT